MITMMIYGLLHYDIGDDGVLVIVCVKVDDGVCCIVLCQVDIDNILMMAETRSSDEMKNSATDELLSQFKVLLTTFYSIMPSAVFCKV